ncbi:MAG: DsbA oxidoreductase [uncultured bacterium]|nr:MAG: DsbA oxidoreductase [uncultured bacterium]
MLKVDIVADLVCPWCFIGKRRLETALSLVRKTQPLFQYETCWRPFFLNPDTPPEGEPYLPFLEKKFGGRAPVEALFDRVREAGQVYGLDYAFEKIERRANTLQAHRLLYWAQQRGNADTLIERLFAAQFQHGEAIGDRTILVGIAAECGYLPNEVDTYLRSDKDSDSVKEDERYIRQIGIRMVPSFILNRQHLIVGAENPTVLADAMLALIER